MTEAGRAPALLRDAEALLARAGIDSPGPDALTLLAHAWSVPEQRVRRARLFDEEVPGPVHAAFAGLVERRRARVPLQHLTGTAHFRTLPQPEGPGVIVPRPETELVAEAALAALAELLPAGEPARVLDLCTGSGALGLALAAERPGTRAVGVEREATALAWARRSVAATAGELEAAGSVFLVEAGDAGDAEDVAGICARTLGGPPHLVVSNPPYVLSDGTTTAPEAVVHDPAAALWGGGEDGLEVPFRVITASAAVLAPGGILVMEHADVQGEGVRTLMLEAGFADPCTRPDYTGRDRFTLAVRRA
ncbi:peptide chain release factor N(5)-glutamine methyltransferase [Brevibacterium sp.]|uniref:N5-glutamine methyltransferase family protein n=1 Tax=Brevibacterium sp. TaxID=1701 RepID=UPI0025C73B10|nr:peptide chain release factor N(5)-glutamine methyltransferase [Brevibacterium sp.]